MTYGELPTTGLYVVLSTVVVWSAILTTQIADVRRRELKDWKTDARRLRKFATGLVFIARAGAVQMAVVLLVAAWHAYETRPKDQGLLETWWSTAHILFHLGVVVSMFWFLFQWFRSMERAPKTPY